jgi:hypothetical protein
VIDLLGRGLKDCRREGGLAWGQLGLPHLLQVPEEPGAGVGLSSITPIPQLGCKELLSPPSRDLAGLELS